MILTFAEDFSSEATLDTELMGTPTSGLNWNRGVLPLITIDNLLTMLPNITFTFSDYVAETTYGKFEDSRSKGDIVTYGGAIYQSLVASNLGNQPDESPTKWLVTNINSLRVKAFLWSVKENMLSALSLIRNLIENQYIYNVSENVLTLTGDYNGWAFEPKGSDYVKIRINQMSLLADTDDQVTVSVINQGSVIDTITLNPNNGVLEFEDTDYTITGKGTFYFVFPSQDVYSDSEYNNPLKYKGFVCYPVVGEGDTPEDSTYVKSYRGNGLNFNVTAYLDSEVYVENNEIDLAKMLQVQFEMDFLNLAQHNANNRSGHEQRIIMDKNLLTFQTTDLKSNTVARKYESILKHTKQSINATFDKFLKSPKRITVKSSTL